LKLITYILIGSPFLYIYYSSIYQINLHIYQINVLFEWKNYGFMFKFGWYGFMFKFGRYSFMFKFGRLGFMSKFGRFGLMFKFGRYGLMFKFGWYGLMFKFGRYGFMFKFGRYGFMFKFGWWEGNDHVSNYFNSWSKFVNINPIYILKWVFVSVYYWRGKHIWLALLIKYRKLFKIQIFDFAEVLMINSL